MNQSDERDRENHALRNRLSQLSEASLRINESLDPDTVLQEVMDSARALTDARFGGITTLNESGRLLDFITSGPTPEEHQRLLELAEGQRLFEYLSSIRGSLRFGDVAGHMRSLGFPEDHPPVKTLLGAPMRHRGEHVGNLYVADKEGGREFTPEDEETLVMFASQAAMVVVNARRYRDEQRARADLETLINTSPVGVVVLDARTGASVSFNREASRIVDGLRNPDQSTEQLMEVMSIRRADGREISLVELPLVQALGEAETVRVEEIVMQVPNGRSVTVLLNATPIHSEDGEVESFVVTLQDMTPLEELERLRSEFLAMVSHELRMPLSSIKGSAATVLGSSSSLDDAEVAQFFRIIDSQADRMHDLIGGLLDVARIETGTLSVNPEPSDVANLVDEAKNAFLSGGDGNNLRIDLPPGLPWVMADRRRIVQVLSNLLSNAARYSPEGSPIRVTAVREGVHVAVSVADEGRGVSADQLPHLFRKFSRIEGGSGIEGSGLGLAICKGIVEAHGGRIWAESDGPGLGARFSFSVPVADRDGPGPVIEPAPPSVRSGRTAREQLRILAVDDDPQTLRYVRDALTRAGYSPTVTADPEDVPRLMEQEKPHLVLLDLMLPGSDGIGLMKDILETADVPVIFLSVYGEEEVVAGALDMGAADYIVKPFSPTELAARIRAALRKRAVPERAEPAGQYLLGDLRIDYPERLVTVAGRSVQLTVTEYELLSHLSAASGRVLTHDQLLQRVWGPERTGEPWLVRNVVKQLRRKLGDDAASPAYIFTAPRVGYRMARGETLEETGA